MIRPQWVWEMLGPEGTPLTAPVSPVFTNRFDAEQWLGGLWRDLAGDGVRTAHLLHDGLQAAPAVRLSTELSPAHG
ncbi:hypothetical protein [Sanguibacter antarcticus]|uniref:Uncharacterized protein n=1 Tax=Sanguibacter antarcticus TaxID=372484 RepID=A0A2A9E1H8_9MICO|nr:hypothetical protein [Sanguibacter antarcticus]PFG32897.1 hypothetical protein ATL42_0749 [Sanguibacter antarcticus]